jgi:hypothetical protein
MNQKTFFDLGGHGLGVAEIHRNLRPSSLYEDSIRFETMARALTARVGALKET